MFSAVFAWQLGGLPPETVGAHEWACVGAFRLLFCRHNFELEIFLRHSFNLFNRNYVVLNCSRLALSET